MASSALNSSPVQLIQHKRFSVQQHDYRLWDLSLSLSGNIAVSGYHSITERTFIDLYSRSESDSRIKFNLFYSKEFERHVHYWRYVSFLESNDCNVVTCIGDKMEILAAENEGAELQSRRIDGEVRCLAVKEGEIFVGIWRSKRLIVFNTDLEELRSITLKEIAGLDYPWDLQVLKDTIFVCTAYNREDVTYYNRALSIANIDGKILTEYKNTAGDDDYPHSIAVNEGLGLVAVLWGLGQIIVYTLHKNKSLLVIDVDSSVYRIRISERNRMILTGNFKTGEIKMHDLIKLYTYENMKIKLFSELKGRDYLELASHFKMRQYQSDAILRGNNPTTNLLVDLQGAIQHYDVDKVADALMKINPVCYNIVDIYRKMQTGYEKTFAVKKLDEGLETTEEARDEVQKLKKALKELEDVKIQSVAKIAEMEEKLKKEKTESSEKIKLLTQHLDQTKLQLDQTKAEKTLLMQEIEKLRRELEKTKCISLISQTRGAKVVQEKPFQRE